MRSSRAKCALGVVAQLAYGGEQIADGPVRRKNVFKGIDQRQQVLMIGIDQIITYAQGLSPDNRHPESPEGM